MTTTADQARSDWRGILAGGDERSRYVLEAIVESVVVDIITNKMAVDDGFAEVIGRRITTMLDATKASH
jgi:hypothetical protein